MTSGGSLVRGFGLLQATALNMSNMVGVGPFITIPLIIAAMGGPQCMLGWLLGAVLALCDGLVWSELAAAMPGTGGTYLYLRTAFGGTRWGGILPFLFIWQFILSGPLEIASGYIGFAQYLSYFWRSMGWLGTRAVCVAVGVTLVALLYRRVTAVGRLTVVLWVGMLATVLGIIASGVAHFHRGLAFDFPVGAFTFSRGFAAGLGSAMLIAMYDYMGYYDICYVGDEVREPARTIPRSILYSVVAVAAIYAVMNLSIIAVLPWRCGPRPGRDMAAQDDALDAASRPGWFDIRLAAILAAAEALLLALAVVAGLPWGLWLLGHVAIAGWFTYDVWMSRSVGGDVSARILTILTTVIAGPFGAAAACMALLAWRRQRTRPEQLAAWYDRIALAGDIDDVTRLADTVAMGRAVGTSQLPPHPFAEVMSEGSLAWRQAALGLIARRFSPAYAPALKAALVTGEPMVRVQAAAVATRVRAGLKGDLGRALVTARGLDRTDGSACVGALTHMRELLATGLIEDDDRAAAETEISRLASEAAAAVPGLDPAQRSVLETELLRTGRFDAFRAVRAEADGAPASSRGGVHG